MFLILLSFVYGYSPSEYILSPIIAKDYNLFANKNGRMELENTAIATLDKHIHNGTFSLKDQMTLFYFGDTEMCLDQEKKIVKCGDENKTTKLAVKMKDVRRKIVVESQTGLCLTVQIRRGGGVGEFIESIITFEICEKDLQREPRRKDLIQGKTQLFLLSRVDSDRTESSE